MGVKRSSTLLSSSASMLTFFSSRRSMFTAEDFVFGKRTGRSTREIWLELESTPRSSSNIRSVHRSQCLHDVFNHKEWVNASKFWQVNYSYADRESLLLKQVNISTSDVLTWICCNKSVDITSTQKKSGPGCCFFHQFQGWLYLNVLPYWLIPHSTSNAILGPSSSRCLMTIKSGQRHLSDRQVSATILTFCWFFAHRFQGPPATWSFTHGQRTQIDVTLRLLRTLIEREKKWSMISQG